MSTAVAEPTRRALPDRFVRAMGGSHLAAVNLQLENGLIRFLTVVPL